MHLIKNKCKNIRNKNIYKYSENSFIFLKIFFSGILGNDLIVQKEIEIKIKIMLVRDGLGHLV